MPDGNCRLCGGDGEHVFQLRLLDRFDVAYFRCTGCGSLQTERPYWLELAYSEGQAASSFDTQAVHRTRASAAAVYTAYRLAGLNGPLLDFGGGSGLLCRTLRDAGLDAWTYDEYADGGYARPFRAQLGEKNFDLLTAFEVLEHLPDPAATLKQMFSARPKVAVMSTVRYRGEGVGWDYLAPYHGQHIFFYSLKAIELIGATYGYATYVRGDLFVFVRKDFARGHRMLRLMRAPVIKAVECAMPLISVKWAQRDGDAIRARHPHGVLHGKLPAPPAPPTSASVISMPLAALKETPAAARI